MKVKIYYDLGKLEPHCQSIPRAKRAPWLICNLNYSMTGFLSVHDAIESLRQIGDIKSRLNKEKQQKDIRHVCTKVAELHDL
ncbi:Protein FAM81B [Dissostichus eleginoides]|uniref:Protein FAM81B n=1 Tax=Dissostichus eleginoides TaxID=100907 RepID=A0AAD9FB42_DISEL|nr:Protein FAM81B [Dissostichus eleginoides]